MIKIIAVVKIHRNVEAVNSMAIHGIGAQNDGIVKNTRDFFFRRIYFTIPRRPLIGALDAFRRQRRCSRWCQGKLTHVFVGGNKKDTRENREKLARSTDRNHSPNKLRSGSALTTQLLRRIYPQMKKEHMHIYIYI